MEKELINYGKDSLAWVEKESEAKGLNHIAYIAIHSDHLTLRYLIWYKDGDGETIYSCEPKVAAKEDIGRYTQECLTAICGVNIKSRRLAILKAKREKLNEEIEELENAE